MFKSFLCLTLLTLSSCSSTHPKKEEKEKRNPLSLSTIEEVAERVQKAVEPQIGEGKNTGAIIGIYLQGKSKILSFGETKKGNKTPPDENTIFEIGSITKAFTGLLLAQEIEGKKVRETDTIGSIQKKWAHQKNGDITLLELVTHRSGLPRLPCNLEIKNQEQPYEKYGEADLNEFFSDQYLKAHPDCIIQAHPTSTINYSNLGFGTLGYLLGMKEKTSYMDLLKKKVLKPLEMQDTTYDLSREQIQRIAQGYDEKGSPVPMWKQPITLGAGGIRSTAADLFIFAQSYIHPETTPIAKAMEHTIQTQFEVHGQKIGYAWNILNNGGFWKNGMTGGYTSDMIIYPKKDFAIFYLTNTAKELKCVPEAARDLPCKP